MSTLVTAARDRVYLPTFQHIEMHVQLLIIEQLFQTPKGHFPQMAVLLQQLTFQSLISQLCVDEAHSFHSAGFTLYGLPAFWPSWGKIPELKASL